MQRLEALPTKIFKSQKTKRTLLLEAIENNNIKEVKKLLNSGLDINFELKEEYGYYGTKVPLLFAIDLYHFEIVQMLSAKSNQAFIDTDWEEKNPLFRAIRTNHLKLVNILLENKYCDVHRRIFLGEKTQFSPYETRSFSTALMYAAGKENIDIEIIKSLIKARANIAGEEIISISQYTTTYSTLLHAATRAGNLETVTLLLDHGDSIREEKTRVTTLVCQVKMDDNWGYNYHGTPMEIAIRQSNAPIAQLFLTKRAECWTPKSLFLIAKEGQSCILQYMLRSNFTRMKSLINKTNLKGQIALHIAILYANTEVVGMLIKAGAKTTIKDEKGKTPYDYAQDLGKKYEPHSYQEWQDQWVYYGNLPDDLPQRKESILNLFRLNTIRAGLIQKNSTLYKFFSHQPPYGKNTLNLILDFANIKPISYKI